MNEVITVGKGLALVNIMKEKVTSVEGEYEPKFQYRIDYIFSASKFLSEVVSETPDNVYDEVRQYITDTITNLQYFVDNADDVDKLEQYQLALDWFIDLDTELKNNNL